MGWRLAIVLAGLVGCRWDCDGEKEWFGEPEGVVKEARGCPGSEDGSGEKAERDEAESASLGQAFFADFRGGRGCEGLVETFGYVAKVAGDEGGDIGEAIDAAETGDLDGGHVGEDAGESHLREAAGEPAEDEDDKDLQRESEGNGAKAKTGAQVF